MPTVVGKYGKLAFGPKGIGVLDKHGIRHTFHPQVEKDATEIRIPKEQIQSRDKVRGYSIDSAGADVRDDAIWVEPNELGWRALVSIADVTELFKFGSMIDIEAKERTSNIYHSYDVIPMLPDPLAALASLEEGEERLTITMDMQFDHNGKLVSYEPRKTYLENERAMSYHDADTIRTSDDSDIGTNVNSALNLALKRLEHRAERSCVFFDQEKGLYTGEDGIVKKVHDYEKFFPFLVVQELAIAANCAAGRFISQPSVAAIYRCLDAKDGIAVNLLGTERYLFKEESFTARGAIYSRNNVGHHSLGYSRYVHFTSPIRRYVDTIVHRILKASMAGKSFNPGLDPIAERCSFYPVYARRMITQARLEDGQIKEEGLVKIAKKRFGFLLDRALQSEDADLDLILDALEQREITPQNLLTLITSHQNGRVNEILSDFFYMYRTKFDYVRILKVIAGDMGWDPPAFMTKTNRFGRDPEYAYVISVNGKEYATDYPKSSKFVPKNQAAYLFLKDYCSGTLVRFSDPGFRVFKNKVKYYEKLDFKPFMQALNRALRDDSDELDQILLALKRKKLSSDRLLVLFRYKDNVKARKLLMDHFQSMQEDIYYERLLKQVAQRERIRKLKLVARKSGGKQEGCEFCYMGVVEGAEVCSSKWSRDEKNKERRSAYRFLRDLLQDNLKSFSPLGGKTVDLETVVARERLQRIKASQFEGELNAAIKSGSEDLDLLLEVAPKSLSERTIALLILNMEDKSERIKPVLDRFFESFKKGFSYERVMNCMASELRWSPPALNSRMNGDVREYRLAVTVDGDFLSSENYSVVFEKKKKREAAAYVFLKDYLEGKLRVFLQTELTQEIGVENEPFASEGSLVFQKILAALLEEEQEAKEDPMGWFRFFCAKNTNFNAQISYNEDADGWRVMITTGPGKPRRSFVAKDPDATVAEKKVALSFFSWYKPHKLVSNISKLTPSDLFSLVGRLKEDPAVVSFVSAFFKEFRIRFNYSVALEILSEQMGWGEPKYSDSQCKCEIGGKIMTSRLTAEDDSPIRAQKLSAYYFIIDYLRGDLTEKGVKQ
ncbi:MAG: RNB domain-containing ribonuclease [Candidatus Saganbacteria bacterium]|nr:RNB domain-containing ribonuclease [Candidatus Saganbacteria bacterium]